MKKKKILLVTILIVAFLIIASVFLPLRKISARAVIMKTDNFSITADMMSYLMQNEIDEYIGYYKSNVGDDFMKSVGLSTKKSLRRQKSPYGNSWFEYFYDCAYQKAKEILLINEEILKREFAIPNYVYSSANETVKSINTDNYNISLKNLNEIVLLQNKSAEYKKQYQEKYSENDYRKYYISNRKKFDCVDYKRIVVELALDEGQESSKIEMDKVMDSTKKRADELLQAIKTQGFDNAVQEYLKNVNSQKEISDFSVIAERYKKNVQFSEWAFDESRKVGDTVMFSGKDQFSIYYLTKTMYPYDYIIKDVQIYETKGNYTVFSDLKSKWSKYENSKTGFSRFADDNGLKGYKSFPYLKEDLPNILLNWIYSNDRKSGDFEICDYGDSIFVMRFEGEAESYFSYCVRDAFLTYEYDKYLKSISEQYEIKERKFFNCLLFVNWGEQYD